MGGAEQLQQRQAARHTVRGNGDLGAAAATCQPACLTRPCRLSLVQLMCLWDWAHMHVHLLPKFARRPVCLLCPNLCAVLQAQ